MKDVLDQLAVGNGRADILRDYRYREDEDITVVLQNAARQADQPILHVA